METEGPQIFLVTSPVKPAGGSFEGLKLMVAAEPLRIIKMLKEPFLPRY